MEYEITRTETKKTLVRQCRGDTSCYQNHIARNRSLGRPGDATTDGEKIVSDTLYARQKVARKKQRSEGEGRVKERRGSREDRIYGATSRAVVQHSLSRRTTDS